MKKLSVGLLVLAVVVGVAVPLLAQGEEKTRQWTVYLAQDKHLDYNWCGSTTEIELRMATLVDYYLDATRDQGVRWNLDCTLWDEVYRRHRGNAGVTRLREAIREKRIGHAKNYAVLLWGILDTETAIRACYGAIPVEQSTGVDSRTALIMENPALTWGAANVLAECGIDFLGRGIYDLRNSSSSPNTISGAPTDNGPLSPQAFGRTLCPRPWILVDPLLPCCPSWSSPVAGSSFRKTRPSHGEVAGSLLIRPDVRLYL